ncbi:MAG: hypothetical protein KKC71_06135 [Chloroflexi bacterium]|nr:hypothetical protein [Chloroflexota bacterium]
MRPDIAVCRFILVAIPGSRPAALVNSRAGGIIARVNGDAPISKGKQPSIAQRLNIFRAKRMGIRRI